jgi:hypothetical protein
MPVSEKAMQLELQSIGKHGAPTLGPAFEVLRDHWRAGERDRELALHLMFLAWYLNIEPSHLTGLDETRTSSKELPEVFNEAHDWLSRWGRVRGCGGALRCRSPGEDVSVGAR